MRDAGELFDDAPLDRFRKRFLRGVCGHRERVIIDAALHQKWHGSIAYPSLRFQPTVVGCSDQVAFAAVVTSHSRAIDRENLVRLDWWTWAIADSVATGYIGCSRGMAHL